MGRAWRECAPRTHEVQVCCTSCLPFSRRRYHDRARCRGSVNDALWALPHWCGSKKVGAGGLHGEEDLGTSRVARRWESVGAVLFRLVATLLHHAWHEECLHGQHVGALWRPLPLRLRAVGEQERPSEQQTGVRPQHLAWLCRHTTRAGHNGTVSTHLMHNNSNTARAARGGG